MKGRDGVGEGGTRAAQSAGEPGDLPNAPVDFSRQTYVTVAEAAVYLRFPSTAAFRMWEHRHPLPKCRTGRRVLFYRKDLDAAVAPEYLKPVRHRGIA